MAFKFVFLTTVIMMKVSVLEPLFDAHSEILMWMQTPSFSETSVPVRESMNLLSMTKNYMNDLTSHFPVLREEVYQKRMWKCPSWTRTMVRDFWSPSSQRFWQSCIGEMTSSKPPFLQGEMGPWTMSLQCNGRKTSVASDPSYYPTPINKQWLHYDSLGWQKPDWFLVLHIYLLMAIKGATGIAILYYILDMAQTEVDSDLRKLKWLLFIYPRAIYMAVKEPHWILPFQGCSESSTWMFRITALTTKQAS